MYKLILKVKNNKEGQNQIDQIKKGYTFTQSNYYGGGTRYHNDKGEELIILLIGHYIINWS